LEAKTAAKSKFMEKRLKAVALVGLSLLVPVTAWCQGCDQEFSAKPALISNAYVPNPRDGTVALQLQVPYTTLAEVANRKLPASIPIAGRHHFGNIKALIASVNIDGNYNIEARRSGPIQVTSQQTAARISVPITFSGHVGFGGDVAKVLGLDKKNVTGSMIALADVRVGLSPDWKPVVNVSISYEWREGARLEIAHGFWLPVADVVKKPLGEMMATLAREAQTAITQVDVHSEVDKVWSAQSLRVGRLEGGEVFLRITPRTAQLSDIEYGSDRAIVRIAVHVLAELKTTADAPTKLPLPTLQQGTQAENRLDVPLLIHAPYTRIQELLISAMSKQTFQSESPMGLAKVSIRDAVGYPSGKNGLTIGLCLSASFEKKFLNTNGWIYLTAEPNIDPARQELFLSRLEFTAALDNRIWDALVVALRDTSLLALVEQQVRIPLKPQLDRLRSELKAALPDGSKPPGIAVTLHDDQLSLQSVAAVANELAVEVVASAYVDARLISVNP
jgi:hypothetical protein